MGKKITFISFDFFDRRLPDRASVVHGGLRGKELAVMDMDFSHVNLEYLLHARDLAREDPVWTAIVLEMPSLLAASLADTNPRDVMRLAKMKPPLLVPRHGLWWWSRILHAVHDGQLAEIEVVMDHAGLDGMPLDREGI
jgi:hypothetical protein